MKGNLVMNNNFFGGSNGFNSSNSFNNYNRNVEQDWRPKRTYESVALAALICGIVSIVFNPGSMLAPTAIILGIVALCNRTTSRGHATVGLICGAVGLVLHAILDTLFTIATFGLGSVFFLI